MADTYNNDIEAYLSVMAILVTNKMSAEYDDEGDRQDYTMSRSEIEEIIKELDVTASSFEGFMISFEEVLPDAYALNSNVDGEYWLS